MANEWGEDLLLADGFEQALLGLVRRCSGPEAVCYDYARCVEILMERDGMSEEEAAEFMDFNVVGAYVGERTPFFLYRLPPEEVVSTEAVSDQRLKAES